MLAVRLLGSMRPGAFRLRPGAFARTPEASACGPKPTADGSGGRGEGLLRVLQRAAVLVISEQWPVISDQ